jgi:ubiquinone/menaquinone biosynthesis C-methylase UbiE
MAYCYIIGAMQQTAHHAVHSHTTGFAHPPRNVGALGIEPGMHVADFGSGSGAYVHLIAERLAHSGHVYAVDIQKDLLQRTKNDATRRGFKNVEVIWSDLEHPGASKIADRKLDLVLISNLLFQLENKKAVLAEAWRILKPTGRLAIIDWRESFGGMGPIRQDVVDKDTALEIASSAGFELLREFPAGAHHYGLIFRLVPQKNV